MHMLFRTRKPYGDSRQNPKSQWLKMLRMYFLTFFKLQLAHNSILVSGIKYSD